MERSSSKVPRETGDGPVKENALDFETLGAIAHVYRNQGNEAFKKGDFLNAVLFYTEGIKVNCNDIELKAKLYNNRAIVHFKLGNYHDSLSDARAATELQPAFLKAIVRGATASAELKKFEEAITWCNKGLAIDQNNKILLALKTQSVEELAGEFMDKKDQGNRDITSNSSGDIKKVFDCCHLNLKIAKERRDRAGEGYAYGSLGNAFEQVGDLKKALNYYNLCLQIAKEVRDTPLKGKACGCLGSAYHKLGDFKKAVEYHNMSLKIFKEMGDKRNEGAAYSNLGIANRCLGNLRKALEYHNLHLEIAREVGDKHSEGRAYGNLGNAHHNLGDVKNAIEYHNLHLAISKEMGDRHGESSAYGSLGIAYDSLGDFKNALKYHNLHLEITKEIGDKHGEGKAHGNLGITYNSLSDFNKAIHCHRLSAEISKEIGDRHGEGSSYGSLGSAYRQLGNLKKSIEYHNLHLEIAKEVGDKHQEGGAYGNLGNAYNMLGDVKKAIEYHNLDLKVMKEVGNKHGEASAYGNLSTAYQGLGDYKKAIEYLILLLDIMKEVGDKHGEGGAYGNLGSAYHALSDFKKAIDYFSIHLEISEEIGDKLGKGVAYSNLGNAYDSLGDFKKALEYHMLHLDIAKEIGDKYGEGGAYGSLGNVYLCLGDLQNALKFLNAHLKIATELGNKRGEGNAYGNIGKIYLLLGDFKKAIEYHNLNLEIIKEIGDKHGEGISYGRLGNDYLALGDLMKAEDFFRRQLDITKEVGDKSSEAAAYYSLAFLFESQGRLPTAVEHYKASIALYDAMRSLLKSKDEWKVNFRHKAQRAYTGFWKALVKQGEIDEALFAAEKGRAQALVDLMECSFHDGAGSPEEAVLKNPFEEEEEYLEVLRYVPLNTVFQAVDYPDVSLWVIPQGKQVQLKQNKVEHTVSENNDAPQSFELLVLDAYDKIGVNVDLTCEDRSLNAFRESGIKENERTKRENPQPSAEQEDCLNTLYNLIIQPIIDLIQGDELVIVPDGPFWLVPYAAFKNADSKFLFESFRIRLAPSLTSFRLIADCPEDYHRRSGALLVGDPWVTDIPWTYPNGEKMFKQLPFAVKEVEMIGKILDVTPLTGRQATKREVLKKLSSVALVHFAAHGSMDTGEIALTPDPERLSAEITKEDFILTIGEVLNAQLRAKLVVLSCCHSGRGEIKAEGVVGIARAFMAVGARSVLVALWAIDDEATLEFMKCFYHHLAEGRRASESLNLAMKSLRESEKFSKIKFWAPFLLIGDDVTLDFGALK